MQIKLSKDVSKILAKMDISTRKRMYNGISALPAGDIKPYKKAPGTYRLRIGGWRILFSYREDNIVLIEDIGPRGQIYK